MNYYQTLKDMKARINAIKVAKMYSDWIAESRMSHSDHTVKSYNATMMLFLQYLENNKMISASEFCAEQSFSREIVQSWLVWLETVRGCSAQTCNVRLANLRAFVKYMAEKDLTCRHIFMDLSFIRPLKAQKKKVEGLTKGAVKAILGTPNLKTKVGFRDAVMLSLLYTSATRITELLSIKLQDLNIDVEYPYLVVLGKGNKIRTINLPKKILAMLRQYMVDYHGTTSERDDILFYSKDKGRKYRMSPMAVHKRIRIYAEKANKKCKEVPLDLHAHQFRHARATHLLDDGLNIAQLSKFLGHESISTTMVYLDITEDMKSAAIKERMNEQIKAIKPKWNKNNAKSILSIFGFTKH